MSEVERVRNAQSGQTNGRSKSGQLERSIDLLHFVARALGENSKLDNNKVRRKLN